MLYPTLGKFLGEYVDQLLSKHDEAIKSAKKVTELISKGDIGEEGAKITAGSCIQLRWAYNFAERLEKKEINNLWKKFTDLRNEGVPLLEWAEKIRVKP